MDRFVLYKWFENVNRDEDVNEKPTGEKERRKSDFLARYEVISICNDFLGY